MVLGVATPRFLKSRDVISATPRFFFPGPPRQIAEAPAALGVTCRANGPKQAEEEERRKVGDKPRGSECSLRWPTLWLCQQLAIENGYL